MKLQTIIDIPGNGPFISPAGTVTVLGSCFADNIGAKLAAGGIDVVTNPFGTLYNPISICNAVSRLDSGKHFTEDDCVDMGAGAGLVCSFEHHTSFARKDVQEFLSNANSALETASAKWRASEFVIITLGTARCWKHDGKVVSNCLKRPGYEFTREMMSPEQVSDAMASIVSSHPGKEFIFTVSPIRHLGEGAHLNQVSKSTLILGLEEVLKQPNAVYFPAFEIVLDELRDYRFYAEDMVHPTGQAVEYIWERFKAFAFADKDIPAIDEAEKEYRKSQHRPMR